MNRKRILIAGSSAVVLIGLLAFGIYLIAGSRSGIEAVPGIGTFGSSADRNESPLLSPDGAPVQGAGTVVAPRLVRISDAPVAQGAVALYIPPVFEEGTSTEPTIPADIEVRFIERQSGNVFAFRFFDRLLSRISNRTLPGVQDAVWTPDGERAFVRYLVRSADGTEDVDTYALPADGSEGYFLEQGLERVSIRATSTVLSLLPGPSGSTATVSRADGTGATTLFTSALGRITAMFSGGSVVATTKPSSGLDGYAFLVEGGTFTRILGPLRGLSTLPNAEGTAVLYSYVSQGRVNLLSYDIAGGAATTLPLGTLPEKCARARGGRAVYCGVPTDVSGNLPEDWYQGARAFTDRIWKIDLETRLATLIVDPGEVADVAIDAVALTLDPQEDILVFTNRRDGTLWAYDL
jgi:hypothetical protein